MIQRKMFNILLSGFYWFVTLFISVVIWHLGIQTGVQYPIMFMIVLLLAVFVIWPLTLAFSGWFFWHKVDKHYSVNRCNLYMIFYQRTWRILTSYRLIFTWLVGVPLLHRALFRLFGYSGPVQFTMYPSTWIKYLPTTQIGVGSYLAAKCVVDSGDKPDNGVKIGDNCLIGQAVYVGSGCRISDNVEIAKGVTLGNRVKLALGTKVGAFSTINDNSEIMAGVQIGERCVIETDVILYPRLNVPSGTYLASKTVISSQQQLQQILAVQKSNIQVFMTSLNNSLT